MPQVLRWEEPETFLTHNGYRILRGYDEDTGRKLCFHYAVLVEDDPDGVGFDIRDLPDANPQSHDTDKHPDVIRAAIDAGHLEPVLCDNCPWTGFSYETPPAKDLEQRVEPGGEMPAGECKLCGALCYVRKRPPAVDQTATPVTEPGAAMVSPPARVVLSMEDGEQLHLNLTEEGLIMDLISDDGEVIGSDCETYVEIAERLGLP